jgi:hypothetical protein
MKFKQVLPVEMRARTSRIVVFLTVASVVIATLVQLVIGMFHGLDISDEGMYLLSAERPTRQSAFHNPFGDYTGLLFKMAFHQVWLFRLFGLLLLALAGILLSFSVYRIMRRTSGIDIHKFSFALIGTLVVPFYYAIGLFTPSYNWLNLFSLCLGVASIVNLINPDLMNQKRFTVRWAAVFTTSVWLGTFAKMSSGPGLVALFTVSFLMCRLKVSQVRLVAITGAISALLLALFHTLFISPLAVVAAKLSRGQEALTVFDPRYDVSAAISDFIHGGGKWLTFTIRDSWWIIILAIGIAGLISFLHKKLEFYPTVSVFGTFALSLIPIVWFVRSHAENLWSGNYDHYSSQVIAVSRIITAVVIATPVLIALRPRKPLAPQLITPLLLLGAVTLYGFGSNNGFVEQITGAAGLLALFGLSMALLASSVDAFAIVAAILLLLGGYFTTVQEKIHPYRQVPQSQQTERIEIQEGSGPLFVDSRLANNINTLRTELAKSQWKPRTPLLDFTQYSAGIVFALKGKAPVTIIPTVGGMKNVDALASWSFDYISKHQTDSEWSNAWLLLPNPNNGIECIMCPNTQVLAKLGRSFPSNYKLVAKSQDFMLYEPIKAK